MNWQTGDHFCLVFRAFKPFRNVEAAAAKELMDYQGEYDVDYSFVGISEDLPYLCFDEAQIGNYDYDSGQRKENLLAQRGQMFKLGYREVRTVLTRSTLNLRQHFQ